MFTTVVLRTLLGFEYLGGAAATGQGDLKEP